MTPGVHRGARRLRGQSLAAARETAPRANLADVGCVTAGRCPNAQLPINRTRETSNGKNAW
jgi:hypothetical protein